MKKIYYISKKIMSKLLLKSKSKEEILEEIKGKENSKIIDDQFYQFFKEEIPFEYLSLHSQILKLLDNKYLKYRKAYNWLNIPDHLVIKHTDILLDFNISTCTLNMFPTRRIPELEHIRSGTKFYVTSYEEFERIIKFLETH